MAVLQELHIKNLALIEEASLDFSDGFTVFTGETGAGKTVLIGALKLLLGERGDSSLIRRGTDSATVEGRFLVRGEEVVVSRTISRDGRNKCYLNGSMSTLNNLSSTLSPFIDLHGQHDHQKLLDPKQHVHYLDTFIGPEASKTLLEYREAKAKRNNAAKIHRQLLTNRDNAAKERNYVEFQLQEIKNANPKPQEDEKIENELPKLRYGEKLTEAAQILHTNIDELLTNDIERKNIITKASGLDKELDDLIVRYDQEKLNFYILKDELNAYLEELSFEPGQLNSLESRLTILNSLKRKYGPTLEDVLVKQKKLEDSLNLLDGENSEIDKAKQNLIEANKVLKEKAETLALLRQKYFIKFSKEVVDSLQPLAMPEAQFVVKANNLSPENWDENGSQNIEFLFTANRGDTPQALARIASGGEISRTMLAIKSALGNKDTTSTIVFDEIDTGIGGIAGDSIGKQMRKLAGHHQIFTVTHLGQVAAYAHQHYVVKKSFIENNTKTEILLLDDRVEEITRMLSGKDTESSRKHARELLDNINGEENV